MADRIELTRRYEHTIAVKRENVTLNNSQKRIYSVPKEFTVAEFDAERVAQILQRKKKKKREEEVLGRLLSRAKDFFKVGQSRKLMTIWSSFLVGYYILQVCYQLDVGCKVGLAKTAANKTVVTPAPATTTASPVAARVGSAKPDPVPKCRESWRKRFTKWGKQSALMIRIITFLLGFYVSSLLKRYWTKVSRIPDAEDALVALGGLTTEKAEEATKVTSPGGVNEAKKMVARYCLLAWTMCFNTFSQPLAENFGKVDQLVEKGLLTEEEQAELLEVPAEAAGTERRVARLASDMWWVPLAWAINLVNKTGNEKAPAEQRVLKDCPAMVSHLVRYKIALDENKSMAENRLPSFYQQTMHIVLYIWIFCSIGMAQDPTHYLEKGKSGIDMAWIKKGTTAGLLLQLVRNFPFTEMCIQGVLLGWLFIADILNNPFGYNLDYDTDLTEELEVNIWRCSATLEQQASHHPSQTQTSPGEHQEELWAKIRPGHAG